MLVLKQLDRAVADGDKIHAVVLESGSNHDGKTAGIFLPNADAQEALARSVYARAGLDPTETLFVESHGTGTQAGDSAEISSIAKVFGREAGRTTELPVVSKTDPPLLETHLEKMLISRTRAVSSPTLDTWSQRAVWPA